MWKRQWRTASGGPVGRSSSEGSSREAGGAFSTPARGTNHDMGKAARAATGTGVLRWSRDWLPCWQCAAQST